MEKAKLIVKNFGPLKDIEIEVREMVTFIGAQASGKSTLAKLLSIFEDYHFRAISGNFESELETYKINSYLNAKTYISYVNPEYSFEYKDFKETKSNNRALIRKELLDAFIDRNKIKINNLLLELLIVELKISKLSELKFSNEILEKINDQLEINIYKKNNFDIDIFFEIIEDIMISYKLLYLIDSIYIPTERAFLHLIAENTLGLINNNVQIPKHLLNSGQDYEKAIQTIKELPLNIIDKKIRYKREGKTSFIYHNETDKIDLLESASGLQSIIPILLLVEYSNTLKDKYNFNFVVEEPELNLYPKAQHELIKYLVKNCLLERRNLILTTHSPFVLASINNLLLAFDKGQSNPKEVAKIIKKESWLNPKNFIAYQLKNGKAYKIMDDKLGQIKENMIDIISDDFSDEFDKLLDV